MHLNRVVILVGYFLFLAAGTTAVLTTSTVTTGTVVQVDTENGLCKHQRDCTVMKAQIEYEVDRTPQRTVESGLAEGHDQPATRHVGDKVTVLHGPVTGVVGLRTGGWTLALFGVLSFVVVAVAMSPGNAPDYTRRRPLSEIYGEQPTVR